MNKTSVAIFLTLLASLAFAEEVKTLNPESLPAPFKNRFSHGKVVPANAEWLYTAGQTGRDVDGQIGEGIEEQADLANEAYLVEVELVAAKVPDSGKSY